MKKHELLTKAMRDYPAGTQYTWSGNKVFTSTGVFNFIGNSIIRDSSTDHHACVYNSLIWAKVVPEEKTHSLGNIVGITIDGTDIPLNNMIVKPSLLEGKCAIQVNNEREFKLLMSHYEANGWKLSRSYMDYGYPQTIYYNNENDGVSSGDQSAEITEKLGFCVISFADFAAEIGIEVPVFVLDSVDGVPIYNGDPFYHVSNRGINNVWRLNVTNPFCNAKTHMVMESPDKDKAFSTKEAAEAWIALRNQSFTTKDGVVIKYDQEYFAVDEDLAITRYVLCSTPNGKWQFSSRELAEAFVEEESKVKYTIVPLFTGMNAYVFSGEILIKDADKTVTSLRPSDLEDMLHAYKSLQS